MRVNDFIAVILVSVGLTSVPVHAETYRNLLAKKYKAFVVPERLKLADECGLPKGDHGEDNGFIFVDRRAPTSTLSYRMGPSAKYKIVYKNRATDTAEVVAYDNGWFFLIDINQTTPTPVGGWVSGKDLRLTPLASNKAKLCLGIPREFPQMK